MLPLFDLEILFQLNFNVLKLDIRKCTNTFKVFFMGKEVEYEIEIKSILVHGKK